MPVRHGLPNIFLCSLKLVNTRKCSTPLHICVIQPHFEILGVELTVVEVATEFLIPTPVEAILLMRGRVVFAFV